MAALRSSNRTVAFSLLVRSIERRVVPWRLLKTYWAKEFAITTWLWVPLKVAVPGERVQDEACLAKPRALNETEQSSAVGEEDLAGVVDLENGEEDTAGAASVQLKCKEETLSPVVCSRNPGKLSRWWTGISTRGQRTWPGAERC